MFDNHPSVSRAVSTEAVKPILDSLETLYQAITSLLDQIIKATQWGHHDI
jgi:hypothetical protein